MVPSEPCIKPRVKPFENKIIAKLIKSVYYLGRGNNKGCESGNKNARICEVIDILRYEDDGSLLKKFLKSDEYLKKYLGFDYECIKHIHSDNDATLICDGVPDKRIDGGFANSTYRRKDIIDLEGALRQGLRCEETSDHELKITRLDGGKSDSIYKKSRKDTPCEQDSDHEINSTRLDGGKSDSIYKKSNKLDLYKDAQCEEDSDNEFKSKRLDGGKSDSIYKKSIKGTHCEEDSDDEIKSKRVSRRKSDPVYKKSNKNTQCEESSDDEVKSKKVYRGKSDPVYKKSNKNAFCEEEDEVKRKNIDGGKSDSIYKKSNIINLSKDTHCEQDDEC